MKINEEFFKETSEVNGVVTAEIVNKSSNLIVFMETIDSSIKDEDEEYS